MAEPKVSILLTLVDKLTAPVEGAKGKLASFGESVTGLGTKIAALGVSAALGAFFKSAVEEASKAEASTIRLGHAVRNAGEDFDTWAPQIDATVNRLAKLTTFSDDDLSSALGNLVTKTGDVKKSIELMGLVTDLAANRNISLEESATLVAKSLNGGGRLFKEYGITVGTAAEKTEQLAQILSGSAAAAADSFGGRLANLGKAWGELKEDAGRAIIENEAIGDALASLTALIDELSPKVAQFVAFIVSDVVTSISRFVTEVQTFGANAALAILGVPDRFKLAWGNLMVAISDSIADSRVLMTIFGDGLGKIADKMGASGTKMVIESSRNLRNLKAGYDETIAGIGKTVAKGEDDKTKTTRAGNKLRLEDEQKTAKDQKEVWTGSANVFKDAEKARAEAAAEADSVIRSSWGLASSYVIREANKVIASHRIQAAALATIIDGMDGVYGAAERVPPVVKDIGDETFNAARGAISLGKEFGVIDEQAASALGNVVNLADSLKNGLGKMGAGDILGAVGSLAGIIGSIFSKDPAHAALIQKNSERLAELKDRLGEVLNLSTPGGKVAALTGIDPTELIAGAAPGGTRGAGRLVSRTKLAEFLLDKGLSLTDFLQMASDLGFGDLGKNGNYFDADAISSFFEAVKGGRKTGFSDSLTGDLAGLDLTNGATGGGSSGFLSGLAGILGGKNGSDALGGLFSGVNLSDGIDAGEIATIRGRTTNLATRFASGQVTSAELGGANNADFVRVIELILSKLDEIAGATSTTAGAVTSGGIGTVSDTDMATSFDLSTAAVGG